MKRKRVWKTDMQNKENMMKKKWTIRKTAKESKQA